MTCLDCNLNTNALLGNFAWRESILTALLGTLHETQAAPLAIPNAPPVLMRGGPDPPGEQVEVILLDPVSNTARPTYGRMPTIKRLQVSCYTAKPDNKKP